MLVLVMVLWLVVASVALTVNPIIAIMAHPFKNNTSDYIAASYVKWIESAGGRVVPIPYSASNETIKSIFRSVNGVLFPGGSAWLNQQAAYVYELALGANDRGEYFPIWGTCLGFEWLVELTSAKGHDILSKVDALNLSLPINYTENAKSSRLFAFKPDLYAPLTNKPLTINSHKYGITPSGFKSSLALSSFYNILATSVDRQGVEFIAAIEAMKYPFYGVQFHPEKNAYEFGKLSNGYFYDDINHGYEAIVAGQAFAHFFIAEARKNNHAFATLEKEHEALIYNYQTTQHKYPTFVEIYELPINKTWHYQAMTRLFRSFFWW
ncbi:gamma-glutamyl hydrolase [Thraustotheca clavata]|uniref:folate gamma-glutamyl hydrolase n=1 Tax=Thraustotheca clavata TaxID=74557 RepID=A0A1W0A5E7_9STRA|nr:gamma-glutamyl hydrolase [Thraustotheca clavata]